MACRTRDSIVRRALVSDTSRIPITISIRSWRRRPRRVACSFDRPARKTPLAGLYSRLSVRPQYVMYYH